MSALKPADFGTLGLGDDAPTIAAAINQLNIQADGYLDLEGKSYRLETPLPAFEKPNGIVKGNGAIFNVEYPDGDVFTWNAGGPQLSRVGVSDVTFTSSVQRTSGTTAKFWYVADQHVINCRFDRQYKGIDFGFFQYGLIHGCDWRWTTVGVEYSQGSGGTISDCRMIHGTGTTPEPGTFGVVFSKASGPILSNIDIVRYDFGLYGKPAAGGYCQFLFMSQVLTDTCTYGKFFSTGNGGLVNSIHGVNCWESGCKENGVYAAGVSDISFTGHRNILNYKDGMYFLNCEDVLVDSAFVAWNNVSNTAHYGGIKLAGCIDPAVRNSRLRNSPGPSYAAVRQQKHGVILSPGNIRPSIACNSFRGHPDDDVYKLQTSSFGNGGGNTSDRAGTITW